MTGSHTGFERRVVAALDASPSRIPVVPGGCGTGRTWLLQRLHDRAGRGAAQYINVERCATTPERFLQSVITSSPFSWAGSDRRPETAREAFETLCAFFGAARQPGGGPCTFLLDEVLELRTFESFPGLRHVIREFLKALAASPNRFVLTTRYVARVHRLLRDATSRFEVMHLPPLATSDVTDLLSPAFNGYEQTPTDDRDYLSQAVQALTDGRAAYVCEIRDAMSRMGRSADPISALTGATLDVICQNTATRAIARAMMLEAQAIGEALGVRFPIDVDKRIAAAEAVGAHKTSMLQDLERGRPMEIEAVVGAVAELGRLVGVATPMIDTILGLVRQRAETAAND